MKKEFWENAVKNLAGTFPPERLAAFRETLEEAVRRARAEAVSERKSRAFSDAAGTTGTRRADEAAGTAAAANAGGRSAAISVACACSGGADSLCALLLLWAEFPALREEFPELSPKIFVFHYDHAVRSESAGDAAFVRDVCAALGFEFVSERCDFYGPNGAIADSRNPSEGALRERRLEFFGRVAEKSGARILVQGHQRDDVAETLLMRLTRGAGTEGLSAPRRISVRLLPRCIIARPILDFPKAEILGALRRCAIPWREDATNAGDEHFRNRVRRDVLPTLRAAAPFENIARSRQLAEEDSDALDSLAARVCLHTEAGRPYGNAVARERPDALGLPETEHKYALFAESPELSRYRAIVRRVLQRILMKEEIPSAGATAVDALVSAVCAEQSLTVQLGGRKIRLIFDGTLYVETARGAEIHAEPPRVFAFPRERGDGEIFCVKTAAGPVAGAEIVALSPELFEAISAGEFLPRQEVFLSPGKWVGDEIFLRKADKTEKFQPLGAPGAKKLGDIFTDKKIPPAAREILPVFADGAGTVWIPGIAPAERLRLAGTERSALRLTYAVHDLPLRGFGRAHGNAA